MANNFQQAPFWDFVRAFEPNGGGVEHPPGPPQYPHGTAPFGWPGPFSWPAHHGFGPGHPWTEPRNHTHPPSQPHDGESPQGEQRERNCRRDPHDFGRRGQRGRGHWHRHGHRGHPGPNGPYNNDAFDMSALTNLIELLSNHPWAQVFRNYAEQAAPHSQEDTNDEDAFTPPMDIFSTESHYILHVSVPGAKKEDIGVNYDAERGLLSVAGVVYRKGDEQLLQALTQSERKIGMFERAVKLPSDGDEGNFELDGDSITAKLEDGVLVVSIPKTKKEDEWTSIKKVDIE